MVSKGERVFVLSNKTTKPRHITTLEILNTEKEKDEKLKSKTLEFFPQNTIVQGFQLQILQKTEVKSVSILLHPRNSKQEATVLASIDINPKVSKLYGFLRGPVLTPLSEFTLEIFNRSKTSILNEHSVLLTLFTLEGVII